MIETTQNTLIQNGLNLALSVLDLNLRFMSDIMIQLSQVLRESEEKRREKQPAEK